MSGSPYDGDLSLEFPKANSRVRGGILADSMGMGKTWCVSRKHRFAKLTIHSMMASLLHTNRQADELLSEEPTRDSASETDDASKPPKFRQLTLNRQWQPTTAPTAKPLPARRHATLVVCPVSLAKQWSQELDRMSEKGTLRNVLWYGNERPDLGALLDTMDEAGRTDVVITTYGTLQSEHTKWLNRQGVRSQLKSLFDGKFRQLP
jgi:DNA repair protein RAD5